jgi:hypothetical protein
MHGDNYTFMCCTQVARRRIRAAENVMTLARSSAQAVLFNAAQLPDIIAELEAKVGCQGDDDIIKQYARLMGPRFRAYVRVPSLFQHVGSISTLTNNGTTHNFHWSTDFVP